MGSRPRTPFCSSHATAAAPGFSFRISTARSLGISPALRGPTNFPPVPPSTSHHRPSAPGAPSSGLWGSGCSEADPLSCILEVQSGHHEAEREALNPSPRVPHVRVVLEPGLDEIGDLRVGENDRHRLDSDCKLVCHNGPSLL